MLSTGRYFIVKFVAIGCLFLIVVLFATAPLRQHLQQTLTNKESAFTPIDDDFHSQHANQLNREFIHTGSEPSVDNSRIFFHETSGRTFLNFRQSCAVESAARENPTRSVQLIMFNETIDANHESIKLLSEYPNIEIYGVNPSNYYASTPFEKWFEEGRWRQGSFPFVHLADYSRILSLWKAGGIYLDLDFVVLKEFTGLHNFSSHEDERQATNSVLGFSSKHPLLEYLMKDMAREYLPFSWDGNGPKRIYKALKHYCNESQIVKMTPDKCHGFRVLETASFYPVYYTKWTQLFDDDKNNNLDKYKQTYALHLWNKMSARKTIQVGSRQLYALAAAKHCPLTFASAATQF